jgi:hypothetical protein
VANNAVGVAAAVYLESSPGALVETSTLCGTQAQQGSGVRITGSAAGTVIRGNVISAAGGSADSHGVWAEGCADDDPWIVDNQLIEAQGPGRTAGVLAVGRCHPVIDTNVLITGGGEGTTADAAGVSCGRDSNGQSSHCAVLNNRLIQGSGSNHPLTAAGVACLDGGCARVAGNVVLGNLGGDTIGIWLRGTGALIEQNRITGGCSARSAAGIQAEDAFSRIQNNLINGGTCAATGATPSLETAGLRAFVADGGNELDVHSNTIDGAGNAATCISVGVDYRVSVATAPTTGKGLFRNNIIRGGLCNTRGDFAEMDAGADPRIFENNDLDPSGMTTTLYYDNDSTPVTTIAEVNAFTDTTAGANLSANPMFLAYPGDLHLTSGSACVNAGTPSGAPATDFDGKPRDPGSPDIGALEF